MRGIKVAFYMKQEQKEGNGGTRRTPLWIGQHYGLSKPLSRFWESSPSTGTEARKTHLSI